jgi:cyclopropane fatty-acyl-phospholipid synthase-like methyltransferase
MTPQEMSWNKTYSSDQRLWGDRPSELAWFAANYLKQSSQFQGRADIFLLDLGCGYGRDAMYLAQNLPCHILGLDNSDKAIEMARESLSKELQKRIEFLCYDFSHVSDKYDIILASNLYHLLRPEERDKFRETVKRCLKTGGLFFLSTLSVRDPQHYGKGTPIDNDANSFQDKKYIHLSTREELEESFDFLNISALFEREFHETRSKEDHHHICWLIMGKI